MKFNSFIMKPLPYPKVESTIVTIGEKKFLKELKEPDSQGFILVSKPKENISTKDKEPIPNEIKDLLHKYSDVTTCDFPSSLPP